LTTTENTMTNRYERDERGHLIPDTEAGRAKLAAHRAAHPTTWPTSWDGGPIAAGVPPEPDCPAGPWMRGELPADAVGVCVACANPSCTVCKPAKSRTAPEPEPAPTADTLEAWLATATPEPAETFDAVFGPAEIPARDRPAADSCERCLALGSDHRGPGVACTLCEGTGWLGADGQPVFGYALFSPDGEQLSDTTRSPAAIVLAAAACHQAAAWLGEPVAGGFALIRTPAGQLPSPWQRAAVDRVSALNARLKGLVK
jgi:hypothetical protein